MPGKRLHPRWPLAVCVLALVGFAVTDAHAQDVTFESATAAYQSADFDRAIEQFSTLAADQSLDRTVRREVFQYLGRSYIAKNLTEKAREVVLDLLELEPPLVELDPDIEPRPLMRIYYDARKQLEGDYTVERADPAMRTLAVMDFTNSSVTDKETYDPLQQGLATIMIHNLSGATDLKVVERERIQWLLEEQALQRSDMVDQQTAVQAGKLLGAHAVLFGGFIVNGRDMWINARLVDVETGEILLTEQVTTRSRDFFEGVEQLSLQVAQAVNADLKEADLGSRTETRSLDAQMSYWEGLGLLDKGQYRAAYEKFLESMEYDPNFTRARLKAASVEPILASESAGAGAVDKI
ncbi:MAG TPA: CsgG/HfaB family protein [Rhodothermales bacterium]